MGRSPAPYSPDLSCPYCLSVNTNVSRYSDDYTTMICRECNKLFRTELNLKRKPRYALLNISLHRAIFNAELQELLNIVEGDYIDFSFTDSGLQINKGEPLDGLRLSLKQKSANGLSIISSDVCTAIREEYCIEFNKPVNLFFKEKNTAMGIIQKSGIKSRLIQEHTINLESFIAIRQTGTTSFSSVLRDDLSLKRGTLLFLYEKDGKLYILNGDDTKFDTQEGFRVSGQGPMGFKNYYSVGSTKLAMFLCEWFKIVPGMAARIRTAEPEEIDGVKMIRLIKVI